jgi:hypothetical protein
MTRIDPRTYRQCIRALETFPGRLRFKHERIALSAGAGVYKNLASSMAPRESKTLSKSLTVKVKIPNASYNAKHHGKPSYAVVGPKRGMARFVRVKTGKGIGAKRAVKLQAAGERVALRRPARYAHLAGPGRRSTFMQRASAIGAKPAAARVIHKLQQGVNEEARRLAAENGVR